MADGIEVGTAIWRAALDRSKLQTDLTASTADIKRAADASERQATTSATSTMQKIQGLSRTALTTVSAGAGALFAVGTKLAVEGTDAMAKFQAQTGATADEAKTAFESMNRLAGENLQSFGTISDALTQVTTNMGVTGQAAEDTTNAILKFSTATGTDAVQNVAAFDDVLDAWGKTAADLPGIMDIIVASTQKFGGSVGEAQQALKDMAPALQGMGASLEDGVGLLDLFRASGADASAATSGLNKALKNLKPGQSLDDLIAQIGAIEDPAKRAQEAIRIFGRSGATLGNVIKPGMTSLDGFKVSMDDAANATTDAASAIEDTLPNKVKLAVSGALAQARSFATDLGPALMGVSSLASVGASIASALKLDVALKGALMKAWAASAVDSGVLAAIQSTGAAWAPKLLGAIGVLAIPFALQPLGDAVRPTEQRQLAILTNPLAHAAYIEAQKLGAEATQAFLDAMTQAFTEGKGVGEAIAAATAAAQAIGKAVASAPYDVNPMTEAEKLAAYYKLVYDNAVATVPPMPAPFFPPDGGPLPDGAEQALTDKLTHMWSAVGLAVSVNVMSHPKPTPVAQLPQQVASEAGQAGAAISDVLTHMWSAVPTAPAKVLGMDYGDALASGLKGAKGEVAGAMADLRDALLHPLRGLKTVTKVEGALASTDLANGLKSKDPYIRSTAEHTRDGLLAKLRALQAAGYNIGKKGMEQLGQGVTENTGAATDAATTANNAVIGALKDTSGANSGGAAIASAWLNGMTSTLANDPGVQEQINKIASWFHGSGPPKAGPLMAPLMHEGGFGAGKAFGVGMSAALAATSIHDMLGLGPMQRLTGGGASIRHEHSGTVQVRLSGDTIAAARAQGASWDDVGRIARSANGLASGLQMRLSVNG